MHIVYTLPLIEIALHYFECEFKDMTEQEQQDHIANLLLTQEERKAARNEKEDIYQAIDALHSEVTSQLEFNKGRVSAL